MFSAEAFFLRELPELSGWQAVQASILAQDLGDFLQIETKTAAEMLLKLVREKGEQVAEARGDTNERDT